jgi:RND family efflux transporter MFP subunit
VNRLPAVYGLLALGAAACGQSMANTPPARPPEEPALTVAAETLATTFAVPGVVQARQHAEISTRMMARVTAVLVEVGAKVREGEPLLRLGTEDVSANRLKAEAAWTAATAARDEAARQAARMDTLVVVDAVSPVQRDQAHVALSQAEAQLALAEAARREVETAAGYATIRAPFTGAVVARHVDAGDLASPGMPLLEFESDGPRDVVLGVPADLAANLHVGDTLAVTAPDGRQTAASIRAVAAGADPRTRTVEVRAAVPADWPTGTTATAFVPEGTHLGIAVPWSSIVRRGQLTGVRLATPNGAVLRWVRLGRSSGEGRVEVLSGLEPGERVLQ